MSGKTSHRWPISLLIALLSVLAPLTAYAQDDAFTRALEKGPFYAGTAAFVGGLLVSLTPCVYPMVAVTVSVFGARQAKSRAEAMALSTSFVGGMVVLFTATLVTAALTGSLVGSALQNRWVLLAISAVFVALALSMFGAFEMVLPESLTQRLSTVGGIGYGGAFLLGLVSGLIAAPCTGPVLTGIILWIGKTQNVGLGALVGATFALGLGLPFWLVGVFAVSLPKAGKWMLWVKSLFGVVLLVVALYFTAIAFPALNQLARPGTTFMVVAAGAVIAGLVLGAIHLDWSDGGLGVKSRKITGIVACVAGAFLLIAWRGLPKDVVPEAHAGEASSADPSKQLLTWGHDEVESQTKAHTEKRPLLVDFTAEWCGACKKMSKETFDDPRVREKAGHFVAVKIDATNDDDPKVEAVMKKYAVVGLPTVVVYDSAGKERKRFNDFVGPDDFLAAIEGID